MENPLQFFTNKESSRADPDYGGVKEEDVLQEESFVTIKVENEDELMDEDSAEASMTIIEDEVIIKMEPIDGVEKSGFSEIEVKTEHDPIDPEVQERPSAREKRRQGKEEKKHLKKSRKDPEVQKSPSTQTKLLGNDGKKHLKKSKKGKNLPGKVKVLKPFVCFHCNYACRSKANLQVHIQSHTGEKPYACDQCDYRAGIKTHLANHKRIHTGERPYECKFCGYRAYQLGNLLEHEKVHSDIRPFKCDHCDYRAKRRRHLTGHMQIHKGLRPYKCDFCNFKTGNSQNLKYHVRRHTGERPYKCNYCSKRFTEKGSMNLHMQKHTGVKVYLCDHCDFQCLRELSMRTHLYKHTGKTPFSCYNCGFGTSYKPTLAKHIQGCHEKSSRIKNGTYNPDPIENGRQEQLSRTVRRRQIFPSLSPFDTSLTYACAICDYTTGYKPALGRHMASHKNCESIAKKSSPIKMKPMDKDFIVFLEDTPRPVERSLRKRSVLKQPGRFSDYLLPDSDGEVPTASHDVASSDDECWIEEL